MKAVGVMDSRAVALAVTAVLVLAFSSLSAVAGQEQGSCPLYSPEARDAMVTSLRETMQAEGFEVTQGAMWIFNHDDIDEDCRDCSNANPTSSYGCPLLPMEVDPVSLLRESEALAEQRSVPVTSATRAPAANAAVRSSPALAVLSRLSQGRTASTRVGAAGTTASGAAAEERAASPVDRPPMLAQLRDIQRQVEQIEAAQSTLDYPALGLARVPPDAAGRVLPTDEDNMSCEWSLREDEVVLVVGCTPPPSKYFAFTPYVHRIFQAGAVRTVFASLGDSFSAGSTEPGGSGARSFTRIHTSAGGGNSSTAPGGGRSIQRGVEPFDAAFAIALGGSRTSLRRAADLAAPHIPGGAAALNEFGIPRQGVVGNLGLSGALMTHTLVFRNAVPNDPEVWRAYARAPPIAILRLTPRRPLLLPAPFPRPTLITRQTVDEVTPLGPAAEAIAESIADYFRTQTMMPDFEYLVGGAGAVNGTEGAGLPMFDVRLMRTGPQLVFDSGQQCIDTLWNCGGDNRDTTYVQAPMFRLPDDDTVIFAVGADHVATGNAHYSNLAIYNPGRRLGILAVDDSEFAGTAAPWLAGTPYVEAAAQLYVVAFARNCGPNPPVLEALQGVADQLCVEVPAEGFPSVGTQEEIQMWERPYSTAGTTVGPWWRNMVLPTLVEVRALAQQPSQGVIPDSSF